MRCRYLLATLVLSLAVGSLAVGRTACAAGDVKAGAEVFKKCSICHSPDEGVNKIGPSLHGVVGRHSASVANFTYSQAMKSADKTWDEATLDSYLADPRAVVSGTKMIFPGLKSDADRQNVIAYLQSLK